MKKKHLLTNDQLKCNFCTQWYSVPWSFAQLQRYSMNICYQCSQNFNYKVIHPSTYEIQDLKLVCTGVYIKSRHQQLFENLNSTVKSLNDKKIISDSVYKCIQQENIVQNTIIHNFQQQISKMKANASRLYQQLIQISLGSYNKFLSNIQSGFHRFIQNKQKLIKQLDSRNYDFHSDYTPNSTVFEDNKQLFLKFAQSSRSNNSDQELKNMEQMLVKFIKLNFGYCAGTINGVKNIDKENQPNNYTNNSNAIRSLRYKLTNKLETDQQQTKYSMRSSRAVSSLSRSKNLTSSVAYTLKTNTTYSRSRSKSRSKLIECTNSELMGSCHQKNREFEIQRQNIAHTMKQKVQFESFMPNCCETDCSSTSVTNRVYGQKNMVQMFVQLKSKTIINGKLCELINGGDLMKANVSTYLNTLDIPQDIQILRMVKVNLPDNGFDCILNWLGGYPSVKTLVVTNNHLTEKSIYALSQFKLRNHRSQLENVYIGNNYIKTFKVRNQIEKLKQMQILVQL